MITWQEKKILDLIHEALKIYHWLEDRPIAEEEKFRDSIHTLEVLIMSRVGKRCPDNSEAQDG